MTEQILINKLPELFFLQEASTKTKHIDLLSNDGLSNLKISNKRILIRQLHDRKLPSVINSQTSIKKSNGLIGTQSPKKANQNYHLKKNKKKKNKKVILL